MSSASTPTRRRTLPIPARACVPTPTEFGEDAYAIEVADESINKILPRGSFAICSPIPRRKTKAGDLRIGSVVYIARHRGSLTEYSLRRVTNIKGECATLATHSDAFSRQHKLRYPPREGEPRIIVHARVIARLDNLL